MNDRNILTKTVTRYTDGGPDGWMQSPTGEFVRYDDIKHLLQDEPTASREVVMFTCGCRAVPPGVPDHCLNHADGVPVNRPAEPSDAHHCETCQCPEIEKTGFPIPAREPPADPYYSEQSVHCENCKRTYQITANAPVKLERLDCKCGHSTALNRTCKP